MKKIIIISKYLLLLFIFRLIVFGDPVKTDKFYPWINIFYIYVSENPNIEIDPYYRNFLKDDLRIIKKLKIVRKLKNYNYEELISFLYQRNVVYETKQDLIYLKFIKLIKNSKNFQLIKFYKNWFRNKVYYGINLYLLPFKFKNEFTIIRLNNNYFINENNKDIGIYLLFNSFFKSYLMKYPVLPEYVSFNKNDIELIQNAFLMEYNFPEFERFLENYFTYFVLLKLDFKRFNRILEEMLYYIKYTPLNVIFSEWNKLYKSQKTLLPYPQLYGLKVIELIKNRKIYFFNFKNFFNYVLKDVLIVFVYPYNLIKKELKNYNIIKKYFLNKYNCKIINYSEYIKNKEIYLFKRKLFIYMGNEKNNKLILEKFNLVSDNKGFSVGPFVSFKKEGGIFINFKDSFNILFLNYSNISFYLRLIDNLVNVEEGYFVIKRNLFERVYDFIRFYF